MIILYFKFNKKRNGFRNFAIFAGLLPLILGALLPEPATAHQDHHHDDPHKVAMLIIDPDSYLVNEAFKTLDLPPNIRVQFFTRKDLQKDPAAQAFVEEAEVVIVDVMGVELVAWVQERLDPAVQRIYALRGSRDDESLRRHGLIFEDAIKAYFSHLSIANIRNLIQRVVHRELDAAVTFAPVAIKPELGIYHPDTDDIFKTPEAFQQWYQSRPGFEPSAPWIGIMLFTANLIDGQRAPYDFLIRQIEKAGLNVMACFGRDRDVLEKLLLDDRRQSRVALILSFSLKFYSAVNEDLRRALVDLDVPVLNAINLYTGTIDNWRRDPIGIQPLEIVWTIAVPEMSGAGEPTPLSGKVEQRDTESGKTVYVYQPIEENVRRIIPRMKGWLGLRRKANSEKRLAILYYNHNQGKQNIGASYLNVFRSLETILARLKNEGYHTGDEALSESDLKAAVLDSGRNIGSWAPGELERMLASEDVVRLPLETYKTWFDALPETFRQAVTNQWGPPEAAGIMSKDGHLIIPAVTKGNLVLLPEPSRGWADAPMKLYHETTLYPHHQYIAAYLWIKHEFGADAMIHLGTHATHEWLPGKQSGLDPSDSPEVLVTDLPNIYPYIVDNIGEGLQAKRRGRGVVVNHLIPPLRSAGLYHEYAELLEMIVKYNRAKALGSDTAKTQMTLIEERIQETGIDMDFHAASDHTHPETVNNDILPDNHRHTGEAHEHTQHQLTHRHQADGRMVVDAALLHELEHYLLEIKASLMPYGLHTFGRSPVGDALNDMSGAIVTTHPEQTLDQVAAALTTSGPREMDHLIRALEGGYAPPAEGNDPIRNIKSIPTGNNFYGFSPDKVPSRAAWEMGKKAAQQIIDKHLAGKGRYPEKVAVVLWATETIRNEGINESTILYLLGLAPQWDRTGRIAGVRVIAGRQLKRPRIDVLVNPSGLYRDLFPHLIGYIDNAIQQAAVQTDIENLVAANTAEIRQQLLAEGLSEAEADRLAAVRIFTEAPGSYGTGVSEVTSASSFWESDMDIVKIYQNRVGFAFGRGMWGRPAKQIFRQNLKEVEVAVHSRSSQLYGLLDNDDMYQYLGGLSLAVKKESGKTPDTLITDQRTAGRVRVEDVARTLGREMRTRYFNPRWIEGMKKENYAGAGQMAKFVEYLWGWQVTTPSAVDPVKWEQAYDVYVEDKYGLELKEFFNRESPWAHQSLTGRMLEAVRKAYWNADEAVRQKLAVDYAVSVIEKGVACCDHTCNNPFLNQMVVNILSLPGVMAPARVAEFKLAIEKAMAKPLVEQVSARHQLQKTLSEGFEPRARPTAPDTIGTGEQAAEAAVEGQASESVEGYKLEDIKSADESTELASSGVQWFAGLALMGIMALFVWGVLRRGQPN
jgi:cobaltochelatase CobN